MTARNLLTLPLAVTALALAAGCGDAITPKVSANLDVRRNASGRVAMKLEVRNETDRPTVPLFVEVDAFEPGTPGGNRPTPVIHPAPFVLNRHESRTLTAEMDTQGEVLAQLSVKESERGILLQAQTKTVDAAPAAAPATAK